MKYRQPLKMILKQGRQHWDHSGTHPDVREGFMRAIKCRTPALGAEVFASENGELVQYHTCKSRPCASCGFRGTLQWQNERWCALPNLPYLAVTFTMPSELWPIFRDNSRLLAALPSLAAAVLQAEAGPGIRIGVMPILHTFNPRLEFNSHVHALVSAWGLRTGSSPSVTQVALGQDELMHRWRRCVLRLISAALEAGALNAGQSATALESLLAEQSGKWWSVKVQGFENSRHFIEYAGRYVRRPPIAQHRIRRITKTEVRFVYIDKRKKKARQASLTELALPIGEFIERWGQHVPRKYSHAIRHFGLFAPRTHCQTSAAIFAMIGQAKRPRPRQRPWAEAIQRYFGWNPLLDHMGEPMKWVRRIKPYEAAS